MPEPMTALQYITSPIYGCCTTSELMQLSKNDKEAMMKLKEYAAQEMKNRSIDIKA